MIHSGFSIHFNIIDSIGHKQLTPIYIFITPRNAVWNKYRNLHDLIRSG